ncbi:MAG: valine--tRNA ligase [Calditrichaeota bacterium]|nr:valine--tRNA ligase [Calditrichota bacterium]
MSEISKQYDPKAVELKWYQTWERENLFKVNSDSEKKPFCIIMPPPNVTGQLHMGHALQDSIQDLLIRMKRMQGFEAHWQAGKDHAGIATQNVVEKELATEDTTRHELGRDKFIERAWAWKERFGNRIFEQKKMLGDSADWSRERFTFDPGLVVAVSKVFKHLYDKGLVYRGNYIVNWCPRCNTAVSDEEVNHQDHDHHLWHFRYPLKDDTGYVTVATTRPETMLGDTAIAVNPKDSRFKDIVGKVVILPLAEREIPVIADEYVDAEFGTGQVKVTPAHDPNDFDMGKRHDLPQISIMDEQARMNENVPERFRGLDRFEARKEVLKALDEKGLLEKTEDYETSIGHCQRCKTIIEPYLSLQWFVKMEPLAKPAIDAVRDGRINFYPKRWAKVYFSWMENIRDWCISRQLWWGHRIPVWYCEKCNELTVEVETPEKCCKCGSKNLVQDEDVLDTWFSSWLWAFSSLGWPEDSKDLKKWYPSDVMVTGYDIIFFWVARMIVAGLEFKDEIPFHDVYITGMIKDEQGRWMSKSLGNGIDPADMIDQYGSDAVRFTLIALASEGQDIRLAPSRFESGRNFANKLWNSYRFLRSHLDRLEKPLLVEDPFNLEVDAPLPDRWIVSRLNQTVEKLLTNAEKYRVNDIALSLYDFVRKEYCDWYLELIKVRLDANSPEEEKRRTLGLAVAIFDTAIKLLHPIMPFITEEIWQDLRQFMSAASDDFIVDQAFPTAEQFRFDNNAEQEMDFLQRLIGSIRNIRSEMRVPPDRKAEVVLASCNKGRRILIEANLPDVSRIASLSKLTFSEDKPLQAASGVVDEIEVFIPLAGLIDLDVERKRLDKEIKRLQGLLRGTTAKLSNQKFLANAPEQVVAHEKKKLEDCQVQLDSLERNRKLVD